MDCADRVRVPSCSWVRWLRQMSPPLSLFASSLSMPSALLSSSLSSSLLYTRYTTCPPAGTPSPASSRVTVATSSFSRARAGGVHGLAQHLDCQHQPVLQPAVLLPVRLEDGLRGLVVGPDSAGLPAAVVARGVALVHLEAVVLVPAGEQEAHAEGAQAAELSVALLQVAHLLQQRLDGDGLLVRVGVALTDEARVVDEDVCVGRDAGHGAGHVLVDGVHLLSGAADVQQPTGDALLSCQHDALARQDAHCRARLADGLDGVLHLVQPPLRREHGGAAVIAVGLTSRGRERHRRGKRSSVEKRGVERLCGWSC